MGIVNQGEGKEASSADKLIREFERSADELRTLQVLGTNAVQLLGDKEVGVVELESCEQQVRRRYRREGRVRRYVQKRRFIEWEMEPCLPIFSATDVDCTNLRSFMCNNASDGLGDLQWT